MGVVKIWRWKGALKSPKNYDEFCKENTIDKNSNFRNDR